MDKPLEFEEFRWGCEPAVVSERRVALVCVARLRFRPLAQHLEDGRCKHVGNALF